MKNTEQSSDRLHFPKMEEQYFWSHVLLQNLTTSIEGIESISLPLEPGGSRGQPQPIENGEMDAVRSEVGS